MGESGTDKATSDIEQIQDYVPFEFGSSVSYTVYGNNITANAAPAMAIVAWQAADGASMALLRASTAPFTGYGDNHTYTHNGKTVYYAGGSILDPCRDVSPTPITLGYSQSQYNGPFAWTMIYGTITHGGAASIPVLWTSPQPHFPVKAKFRETFEIEVTDA